MQLRLETDYAIRAMLYLAATKRVVNADEIALAMGISPNVLRNIMQSLKKNGFIHVRRGAGGGYELARQAAEISLFDIMEVTEQTMQLNHCLEGECECSRKAVDTCPVRKQYTVIQDMLHGCLRDITLEKLLNGQ